MLTVDDRLRAAATEVRDYTTDLPLPELGPTLRPAPEQGPTVRRGLVALVAAAVVVLLAVGSVALWTFTGVEEPVATTLPATTTVPETTATPTTAETAITSTTVAVPEAAMTWTRVQSDAFADIKITAVAEGGPGLVAVGLGGYESRPEPDSSPTRFIALASADGESWVRVADIDTAPDIWFDIVDVARGPAGFVAVGNYNYEAAVFHSPDGISWTWVDDDDLRSGPNPAIWGVTAWEGTYLAVGSNGETVAAWRSVDGLEWSQVNAAGFGSETEGAGSEAGGVVAGDFGVAMVGQEWTAGGSDADGAVWRSTDGLEWDRITVADETNLWSISAAPSGNRFLAFGERGIWTSNDGYTWQQVAGAAGISNGRPPVGGQAAWLGDTIVAGGWDMGLSLWSSNDGGITWVRLGQDDPAFEGYDPKVYDVIPFGSSVVVVGEGSAEYLGTEGAVWIGGLDD